jgi:hypothetical protein
MLPIYMDRINVFFSPLYGFDMLSLWHRNMNSVLSHNGDNNRSTMKNRYSVSMDSNELVVDFLRRQEKWMVHPPRLL